MPKLFVILDGIGDRPCKILAGKSPLEYSKTPNLDYFAENGSQGYVYPVSPKVAPESDVAVTAMLGYDPYKYYTGRGPLEAVGAGMRLPKEYIALRANFATVIGNKLVDRRAGRTLTTKEAKLLEGAINKIKLSHKFKFKSTLAHRGLLIIEGKFSPDVSNVDPAYKKQGTFGVAREKFKKEIPHCYPLDSKKLSKDTAKAINEFIDKAHKILINHEVNKKRTKKKLLPANFITLRDAGVKLPKFPQKVGWSAVTGMPLEKGIAKLTGMKPLTFDYPEIRFRNVRRFLIKSLKVEIKEALKKIKEGKRHYYIHLKQTDIPGHDGEVLDKVKMIELIDKRFFKKLRKMKNLELIVTGDHSTPCEMKAHSSDPVPLLLYGKEKDSTVRFTEKESKKGSLGKFLGKEVFKKLGF